jgi:hypothetical protein
MSTNKLRLTIACAAAGACTSQGEPSQVSAPSDIRGWCAQGDGSTTEAGQPFANDFIRQQWTWNAQVQLDATPHEAAGGPIDAVIGLASGPADGFADLGPIIRFAPNGMIDARDGDHYAAMNPAPYEDGTDYLIGMRIDFDARRYTATVGHYNSPDAIVIAQDYAFRTEQHGMVRADSLARFVDSPTGSISICGYADSSHCIISYADAGGFVVTPFNPQAGRFHLEIEAHPVWPNIDAVIGLSATTPTRFSDLAAIFRFNPDGTMDVRDGGTYRADVALPYTNDFYTVGFDVDVPTHTYSVSVTPRGGTTPTRIATDYRFRTEQAAVGALGVLGQYVDGNAGGVQTCGLLASY